ncbi:MAG: J domain-containing protein [Gammaproteobacteria bacterium]
MNPYRTLGVTPEAGDEAIHQAYLQAIRHYPPERDQQKFQRVREAYETINTHRRRLAYELFYLEPPDVAALLEAALPSSAPQRPREELIRRTLKRSLAATPSR